MRISPIVLLLFVMVGCGSGTQPAKSPTENAADEKTADAAPKPPKVIPDRPTDKGAIGAAIREAAGKPTGELTKADLEKVKTLTLSDNQITDLTPLVGLTGLKSLVLDHNQITDLTPLAGLTKLTVLLLSGNPDLTQAKIDKLRKALPNCHIVRKDSPDAAMVKKAITDQLALRDPIVNSVGMLLATIPAGQF